MADRYGPPPRAGERYDRSHYDNSRDSHREYGRAPADSGGGDMYRFRGAANDNYRPGELHDRYRRDTRAEQEFSFKPINQPPAPSFPPADRSGPNRPRPQRHNGGGDNGRGDRRGGRGRGGFQRFKAQPAHKRDLMNAQVGRSTTPEQMVGMNDAQVPRFHAELDSSGDEGLELAEVSEEGEQPSQKRAKVFNSFDGNTEPKWSNPDPYSVLPPVVEGAALPKTDIVKVIRKAKVAKLKEEQAGIAASNDGDFISLNTDTGDKVDELNSESEDKVLAAAPNGTSDLSRNVEVTYGTSLTWPGKPTVYDPDGPPPPPSGTIMPTDEEVREALGAGSGSKKRKYEAEQTEFGIKPEWQADDSHPTPWCPDGLYVTESTALRLHNEISDFYEFFRPTAYEEEARRDLIKRIQTAVSTFQGGQGVEIKSFGSFAAGLYLPTADMDLVAISDIYMGGGRPFFCQNYSQMHQFRYHIQKCGIAKAVTVISKARVPLVKFVDLRTGLQVDISFENDSGLQTIRNFERWKAEFPGMPAIVLLIKQLLKMRGLNEVFTGGLGGFSIICLVVSMMQLMPDIQWNAIKQEEFLGALLVHFLNLYGNKFDIRQTGIWMDPPGYFDKIMHPAPRQNADRLTIVDPNKAENDISGGSREINAVLDCFRNAHSRLQQELANVHIKGGLKSTSILGCIWGGNYASFEHQRRKLRSLMSGQIGDNGYNGYIRQKPASTLPPPSPMTLPARPPPPHASLPARPPPSSFQARQSTSSNAAHAGSAGRPSKPAAKHKKDKQSDVISDRARAETFQRLYPTAEDVPTSLTRVQLRGMKQAERLKRKKRNKST